MAKNNHEGNPVSEVNYIGYKDKTIFEKLKVLDDYLTEYEYALAYYNALLTIDGFINEFIDEEEAKTYSYETFKITNRATLTIPGDVSGNEDELKNDEEISKISETYKKNVEQISKKYDLGIVVSDYTTKYDLALATYKALKANFDIGQEEGGTLERRKALTKVISQLKKIGYIKADEAKTPVTVEELFTTNTFFASVLKTEFETLIVSKYKMALVNQQENYVTNENLHEEYKTLFESQKTDFTKSSANYEAKLESTSANSYIAYHPNYNKGSNYGYVASLLIGFNKEQQALIDAYETNSKFTDSERLQYRENMLKNVTAKDLR
ncbi:MAG: hypothetical protein J6R29_01585, partial [Clostridia bacterium]|nr:hypothetical protein [Clostridia bacterium]